MLLYLCICVLAVILGLITSVQLLYLESLRLRTRDLASLRYFKDTLEDKIGLKTEDGAACFSVIKHSTILFLGMLYLRALAGSSPGWPAVLEAIAFGWITMVVMTYAVPQLVYRRTSGHWLLPLTPLLRAFAWMARPFVGLFGFFRSLIDLGDDKAGVEEPPTPAENIEALITAGAEEGLIEEEDRKLIQSVVEFGDKVVREVMTPRPNMVAVPVDSTLEHLRQLVIHEQYSRIPVYAQSIDDVLGFVHVRDMFELEQGQRERSTVRELMRPIRVVPESKPVHDLMREMQQEGTHMVIVVDEYGNTAGLASMEDLLEVILGEIRDEHEPEIDVKQDNDGGYIVSGSFDLARLDEMFDFRPHEDIESTTVGGLMTEWLGHVPKAGEAVERDGLRFEVLASDDLRVEQVRMSKLQVVTQ